MAFATRLGERAGLVTSSRTRCWPEAKGCGRAPGELVRARVAAEGCGPEPPQKPADRAGALQRREEGLARPSSCDAALLGSADFPGWLLGRPRGLSCLTASGVGDEPLLATPGLFPSEGFRSAPRLSDATRGQPWCCAASW